MRRIVLLAAVLVLAPAGAALADSFDSVFKDYTADGRINPCKHSAAELQRARANVPPDIQQYAPDFPEALDGLGVRAALAALSALGYALVRWRAGEPGGARRARHSLGEAGWRISATWAEFADWVRLGQR